MPGTQHRVIRKGVSPSRSGPLHEHVDRIEFEDDEGRKTFLGITEVEDLIQEGDSFFIVDDGLNDQHQVYPVECKQCHRHEKVFGSSSKDDDWELVLGRIDIRPH
jgi:hypothetical protein